MAKDDRKQSGRSSSNSRSKTSTKGRGRQSDQPVMRGWANSARERPLATAAAVGGAVAAGVFLWSRRSQISDQVEEWSEGRKGEQREPETLSARSSTPMGTETGKTGLAGAGTSAGRSTGRATGGRGGKAQTGQATSPSRDTDPAISM